MSRLQHESLYKWPFKGMGQGWKSILSPIKAHLNKLDLAVYKAC